MKKMLGVAAAALLASAGAASAGTTTNVTISLLGYSCTVSIVTHNDKNSNGPGDIVKSVLLTGSAPAFPCNFVGAGTVGKVTFAKHDTRNIATLVGNSTSASSYRAITVLLDYPFVSGGNYWAYYTTDGVKEHFVNKGTYSVSP